MYIIGRNKVYSSNGRYISVEEHTIHSVCLREAVDQSLGLLLGVWLVSRGVLLGVGEGGVACVGGGHWPSSLAAVLLGECKGSVGGSGVILAHPRPGHWGSLGAPRWDVGVEGLDRPSSQWPTAHGRPPGKRLPPSHLVGGDVAGVDLVLPVHQLCHHPHLLLRAAAHLSSFSWQKLKLHWCNIKCWPGSRTSPWRRCCPRGRWGRRRWRPGSPRPCRRHTAWPPHPQGRRPASHPYRPVQPQTWRDFWVGKCFAIRNQGDNLGAAWEFLWLEMCSVEMASTEQLKSARRGRRGARE